MTISMIRATFLLTGTIAAGMYGSVSMAADVETVTELPAVSGINGKVEIGGGWADLDDLGDDEIFRGAAAFSFPVGDMFGIQADVYAVDVFSETTVGGAAHAFMRDPNSYLLGVYGGYADAGSANVWYVGPEAELYLDNISIEAIAGFMDVSGGGSSSGSEAYVLADLALYATDNFRMSIGASSIGGFEMGRAGLEWFMGDTGLPVSLKLDGRVGEDGFASVMAGVSLYFGGEDKSLIRRHREDDPPIYGLDIFGAFLGGDPAVDPCVVDPESCAPCQGDNLC
jgi:hypothetical protein